MLTCLLAFFPIVSGGLAYAAGPDEAIVRVNREVGGHCTGFAIDRRTIVTAAHCVWLARPRNWVRPSSLHVLVGYDVGKFKQHLRVKSYRVAADYKPGRGRKSGSGSDWALLTVTDRIQATPMPLAKSLPALGRKLSVVGFSSKRRHRLMRMPACTVKAFTRTGPRAFAHSCKAGPGFSGSPMFAWSNGKRVAFGVHTAVGGGYGLAFAATGIRADFARRPY